MEFEAEVLAGEFFIFVTFGNGWEIFEQDELGSLCIQKRVKIYKLHDVVCTIVGDRDTLTFLKNQ